jgi:hypothetical protein
VYAGTLVLESAPGGAPSGKAAAVAVTEPWLALTFESTYAVTWAPVSQNKRHFRSNKIYSLLP